MATKTWEDFQVGQRCRSEGVTVTEAHLVQFAGISGDFYPLHVNEEFANKTRFGGRIAQGPLLFSMAVGAVIRTGIFGDSVIAWLGGDKLRFPAPVFPGDTVYAEAEVLSRSATSSPGRGICVFGYNLKNGCDELVMTAEMTFLMRRHSVI